MLNVYGIQLTSDQYITLPVSIGTLWSYIESKKEIINHFCFCGWAVYHPKNDTVLSLLPNLYENGRPDVILVSLYMWNRNRSNKITKAIKELYPDVKIIVGGNDVPQNSEKFNKFITDNPQYDYYVHSEGEIALEMILKEILFEIKGVELEFNTDCFTKVSNGKIVNKHKKRQYLNHKVDLDFPSAAELGLYDDLIKNLPTDLQIQGVIETNRGCPYSCTFCDWGLEEKLRKFHLKRIKKEIDWMIGNVHEIMFADANFGICKRDIDIAKYIVKAKHSNPNTPFHSTAITYAKNNKERVLEIAEILERFDFSRNGATFALQSLNPATLKSIKRDNMHIAKDFEWIAENFIKKGIPYYHEMIMGLPLETKDTFLQGLSKLLRYNPIDINIYKLGYLENSEIALMDHSDKYDMKWTKFEHGPSLYEDEKEYTYLIRSTNTISKDDMKYIKHIRDLIQILWLGKTIFYVGRFLQQELAIEACDLIESLVEYGFSEGDKHLWGELFLSKEDSLRDERYKNAPLYFSFGQDRLKYLRYTNAWLYIHGKKSTKERFYTDLKNFLIKNYDLQKNIIEDLVTFNKNICVDGEQTEFKHKFTTQYNWIEYFISKKLKKIETTYNCEINLAGSTKVKKSEVDTKTFLYYIAGGHEFTFNKQNAFDYSEGYYSNKEVGSVPFISKMGMFYNSNKYFSTSDDIIKIIMKEKLLLENL